MATNTDLQRAVRAAVDTLDLPSEEDVYTTVKAALHGQRAACGNPSSCAVALYIIDKVEALQAEPDRFNISVGPIDISIYDGEQEHGTDFWGSIAHVTLPPVVSQFIGHFDDGRYLDIADESTLSLTQRGRLGLLTDPDEIREYQEYVDSLAIPPLF